MSYNHRANHKPLSTAGKITILTAVSSLFIFLAVFLLNLGQSEIGTVQAQTSGQATTSVNVQNTPPEFDPGGFPEESVASASTSPTNSGDSVTFIATATDQNAAPYFLIVCEDDGSTSAQAASSTSGLGTAPPTCVGGGDTYAVSTSTVSGAQASVSFTTAESNPEENPWIAFACDDDPDNPECSPGYTGDGSATSSPFVVNHRPVFDINTINPSGDPGGDTIEFIASSTDQDTFGGQDTVQLFVCIDAVFDAATPECTNGTIASSTLVTPGTTAPNAATVTPAVIPDATRDAFVFLVDEHNHPALLNNQGTNAEYTINNVAPTIDAGFITLNNGDPLSIDTPLATSGPFTVDFVVSDLNSCRQDDGLTEEIDDYQLSVYRNGTLGGRSTTTCATTGDYDPNVCYPHTATTSNSYTMSCSASSTASNGCGGTTDATETWSCQFSLWFVADPTDNGTPVSPFESSDWRAAVAAIDDDGATTSVFTQSDTPDIEVISFSAFELETTDIPYGSMAPGEDTFTIGSSSIPTDVRPTGNTGIDIELEGLRMCPDSFTVGNCPVTSTSSIAAGNQFFASSSFGATTSAVALTTGPDELELDVLKATTTPAGTQPIGTAYWAIQIPGTITFAGAYTGRNTFTVVTAETADWTP